jgi:dipeptidyl aminopeptidase/acylaminoacyl peptidase
LWDVLGQKDIWKGENIGWTDDGTTKPGWKYDGSEAVIQGLLLTGNTTPELISLTPAGQTKELTNLGKEVNDLYLLYTPKWSPDGRYIAFSYMADIMYPLDSTYLYVLNTQTGQVTNYCISPVSDFYWSPDSSQIAIERGEQNLIILDIESGKAQIIDGVSEIYGWVSWTNP